MRSSIIEYKTCKCGNTEMVSDYHYNSEELYESCDVCGYYHTVSLLNKSKDGKYPIDWKPKYENKEGTAGYVTKIFQKELEGYSIAFIEKATILKVVDDLKTNLKVPKFAVTFKDSNGNYQTQIYDKGEKVVVPIKKEKKFRITHSIDVLAFDEVEALKKAAISQAKDEDEIKWINELSGSETEITDKLSLKYLFDEIIEIKN
jgi:hypothetical protein